MGGKCHIMKEGTSGFSHIYLYMFSDFYNTPTFGLL